VIQVFSRFARHHNVKVLFVAVAAYDDDGKPVLNLAYDRETVSQEQHEAITNIIKECGCEECQRSKTQSCQDRGLYTDGW